MARASKPTKRDLFDAVARQDARAVKRVLAAGVQASAVDADGYTPLHRAASLGDLAIVKILVKAGAKLDRWNATEGQVELGSPLYFAAARGHVAVVRELLRAGASATGGRDGKRFGLPLLPRVVERGEEIAGALLAAGADPDDGAPLHAACRADRLPVIAALLAAGADPEAKDARGKRPIDHARSREAVELLAGAGATVQLAPVQAAELGDLASLREHVAKRADLAEALHAAARAGRSDAARLLVDAGVDPAAADAVGRSAYEAAAEGGVGWLVRDAIAKRADLERLLAAAARGDRGELVTELIHAGAAPQRALHVAIEADAPAAIRALVAAGAKPRLVHDAIGRPAALRALLAAGADANAADDRGATPLHRAARAGAADAIAALLEHGARVDAIDASGATPLHEAAASSPEAVHALLAAGAPVDRLDSRKHTALDVAADARSRAILEAAGGRRRAAVVAKPARFAAELHEAIDHGDDRKARSLIQRGADLQAVYGSEAWTPLVRALRRGRSEIAELLVTSGADPRAKSPLHAAAAEANDGLARLLVARGATLDAIADNGRTVAHEASAGGLVWLVEQALDAGVPVDAVDADGATPLHAAATWGQLEAARVLVARGATVDARDRHGTTPLGRALGNWRLRSEDAAMARFLVEHGADRHSAMADAEMLAERLAELA